VCWHCLGTRSLNANPGREQQNARFLQNDTAALGLNVDQVSWFGPGQRTMQLLYHPAGIWGENGKKKEELVGQDKGSLTEQQTK